MEYYNQKVKDSTDTSVFDLNYCKAVLAAFPDDYYPSDSEENLRKF